MAEYRKWTVQHDTERSRIADPPGFDPAAPREQVGTPLGGGRRRCVHRQRLPALHVMAGPLL